jgi:hypothetical protein
MFQDGNAGDRSNAAPAQAVSLGSSGLILGLLLHGQSQPIQFGYNRGA